MTTRMFAPVALALLLALPQTAAAQSERPNVLVISVDGLKPDLVLEGDRHGIELANIRGLFLEKGAFPPSGMRSVTPSLTYPNHQALITGTHPATNGTVGNAVFDPEGVHDGAWQWWASAKVPTLWAIADAGGYFVANVGFPTSGGVIMDVNLPDFWRDSTVLDDEVLNMVATPPGFVREMLAATEITAYPGDAFDLASDRKRHLGMMWVLDNKVATADGPFFMTGYYASYDHDAHDYGVYSPEALASATAIDAMVGELVARASAIAQGNLVVVLASDHGFLDLTRQVRPNVRLQQAGLIQTDDAGKVTGWQAYFQRAGGMGHVRLGDPADGALFARVETLLKELDADPESGVAEVLSGEGIAALKSFPQAQFVLIMEPGVEPRDNVTGDYVAPELGQMATHGFLSDMPDMKASLFIAGPGVPAGSLPEDAAMIDVAPTLAAIMGLEMPTAEGRNLLP